MALQWTVQDTIHHVVFDAPAVGQAWSVSDSEQLLELLAEEPQAILFSSRGRIFCSGGNLADYAAAKADRQIGISVNRVIRGAFLKLSRFTGPTAVVVSGDVFGGGLEMMSCFDRVVAAPHVLFHFWQRKIGLSFGWGGAQRLRDRMGESRLRSAALSAVSMTAPEALGCGMVDELAGERGLAARAERWLQHRLRLPKAPAQSLKTRDLKDEAEFFEELWLNPEHSESLSRFVASRRR